MLSGSTLIVIDSFLKLRPILLAWSLFSGSIGVRSHEGESSPMSVEEAEFEGSLSQRIGRGPTLQKRVESKDSFR